MESNAAIRVDPESALSLAQISAGPSEPRAWRWIIIGTLGLSCALIVNALSFGPETIEQWRRFSHLIAMDGVATLYQQEPTFSSPPLAALFAASLGTFAERWHLLFPIFFRLPGVLAHLLTALMVWWGARRISCLADADRSFGIFSIGLVSLMLTSYEGGPYVIATPLIIGSLLLVDYARAPFLAGLAIGMATNFTLAGLLFVPSLFIGCRTARERGKVVAGFLPWLLPFLLIGTVTGTASIAQLFHSPAEHPPVWGFHSLLLNAHILSTSLEEFARLFQFGVLGLSYLTLLFWAKVLPENRRLHAYEFAFATVSLTAVFSPLATTSLFLYLAPLLVLCASPYAISLPLGAGIMITSLHLASLNDAIFPLRSTALERAPSLTLALSAVVMMGVIAAFIRSLRNLLLPLQQAAPRRWQGLPEQLS